jgi:hypothetical protein
VLINYTELQGLVINEFARRFKDEYKLGTERGESIEKNNNFNLGLGHGIVNQFNNLNPSQNLNNFTVIPSPRKNFLNTKNSSFTADLITKLISKYI